MQLIFAGIVIVLGLLLVIGGFRKWPYLIDPPEKAIFYHHVSMLRTIFLMKLMPAVAVIMGLVYLAAGTFAHISLVLPGEPILVPETPLTILVRISTFQPTPAFDIPTSPAAG